MAIHQPLVAETATGLKPISLQEHDETAPLELSDRALQTLSTEVNDGQTRLEIIEQRDGDVRLKATDHVGIVSLPDGHTIEIQPKAEGTDLLSLLRYAHGVEATTIEESTSLRAGRAFVEALAALYKAELDSALDQGFHRDYRRTSEAVSHVRGRLDVKRQLQRQGPMPTEFECTFDELTADTTVNRGVLYATTLLTRFVRDRSLSQALDRHGKRLRRHVTLTPVPAVDLDQVELTRLADHYTDLLRLTKLVLRSVYIEELRSGYRASYALLVSMNTVFEKAIERAVREAVSDRQGWSVEGQASSRSLVTGGKRSFEMRPDVLVRNEDGRPVLVGDAKWKLHEPDSNNLQPSVGDIYQLIAYELAHNVPGILFYPEQAGEVASEYTVQRLHPLHSVEVPISSTGTSSSSFASGIREAVVSAIESVE